MPAYEVYVYSNTGVLLKVLTKRITRLEWSRRVNDVGSFALTLSDRLVPVDTSLFQLNGRMAIYRKATAFDTPKLELVGLIRGWEFATDERGVTRYTWRGPDQNALLADRICFPWHPYTAGFWHPNEYGYADTLMRTLAEDNMGTGSSNASARDVVTSNGAGLTIAVESSATATACTTAGQMWVEHNGKSLLQVLQEIGNASKTFMEAGVGTAAVPVYFDLNTDTDTQWTFRTYTTRRGMNHRADSGQAVYIGMSYGNLVEPRWDYDRAREVTAALGIKLQGAAPGDTVWATDATRIGEAPLNRREGAVSTSEDDTGAAAHALLNETKPKAKFSGKIKDVDGCRYGVHWGLGDELSADYLGKQYNVMIMGIDVKCAGGRERMEPTFEVIE